MKKQRSHNEWVQSSVLSKCPSCGASKAPRSKSYSPALEDVLVWGEYINAKWNTVQHFCNLCAERNFLNSLSYHIKTCGCSVKLCARSGYVIPSWLRAAWDSRFGQLSLAI